MNRVENLAVEFADAEKNGDLDYTLPEGRATISISCSTADLGAKLVSAGIAASFITPDEGASILRTLAQPADCMASDDGWATGASDAQVLAANQGLNNVGAFLQSTGRAFDPGDDVLSI